jgi:hypothetical protein
LDEQPVGLCQRDVVEHDRAQCLDAPRHDPAVVPADLVRGRDEIARDVSRGLLIDRRRGTDPGVGATGCAVSNRDRQPGSGPQRRLRIQSSTRTTRHLVRRRVDPPDPRDPIRIRQPHYNPHRKIIRYYARPLASRPTDCRPHSNPTQRVADRRASAEALLFFSPAGRGSAVLAAAEGSPASR